MSSESDFGPLEPVVVHLVDYPMPDKKEGEAGLHRTAGVFINGKLCPVEYGSLHVDVNNGSADSGVTRMTVTLLVDELHCIPHKGYRYSLPGKGWHPLGWAPFAS